MSRKSLLTIKALLLLAICCQSQRDALAQADPSWTVPISVQTGDVRNALYFGGRPNATAGFDADVDTVAPPPPFTAYAIFMIQIFPNTLQADYRGAADSISWSLRILGTNGATSQVSWDTSKLRAPCNGRLVMNDTLNMLAKTSTTFVGDQTVRITSLGTIVSVKSARLNTAPKLYRLEGYPNPFAATTTLEISLPTLRPVAVRIFNLLGEEIRAFNHAPVAPGLVRIPWDGRDARGIPVPNGIYFCRLEAPGVSVMRKLYRIR